MDKYPVQKKKTNALFKSINLSIWLYAFFYATGCFCQLTLSNGVIININGGSTNSASVYLTLNNPPTNPIILSGTGTSGIRMETEFSISKYNLGTATTAITIPYVSSDNEYFPLTLSPTAAGTGSGSILFSSKKAATRISGWNNANYTPSDVNNMNSTSLSNNSASVLDRFWILDVVNYTSSPAANFSFSYINAEAAANGGNTINLTNLQAQAFDKGALTWGNFAISGTNITGASTGTVSNVSVSQGLLGSVFRSWALVDNSNPLPIEMLDVTTQCTNGLLTINWTTLSETNSGYFEIEKSNDGTTFQFVNKIPAAGNSLVQKNYAYQVGNTDGGANYFKISERDRNGALGYTRIISATCSDTPQENLELYTFEDLLYLSFDALSNQNINITCYDLNGRLVYSNQIPIHEGKNVADYQLILPAGIYLFQVETKTNIYKKKLILIKP